MHDINGIPLRHGDLIRVFHFTAARNRRKIWMYKKVFRFSNAGLVLETGPRWRGVHMECLGVVPISGWRDSYEIVPSDEFEIIDGESYWNEDGELVGWWERPRVKNRSGHDAEG